MNKSGIDFTNIRTRGFFARTKYESFFRRTALGELRTDFSLQIQQIANFVKVSGRSLLKLKSKYILPNTLRRQRFAKRTKVGKIDPKQTRLNRKY
jgi:hypothetical protein